MLPQRLQLIIGIIATALFAIFVFGLSQSISSGFAGFWGGLPFALITLFVFGMALYDLWDETVRKKD
jgi:hypothetical protein